jgi:sporulation protein YlmC with PRC-barrel domain
MKEIPLKAKVQCSDSPCGKSTNVILNRDTHQVTHVAIEDKKLPDNPTRLVPIDNVASTTQEQITLNCTRDEVTHMEPFIISQVIQETGSGMAYATGTSEYVVDDTGYDVVNMEQVPAGEMALDPGMKIIASDHTVGKLDELVLDPQSGAITHLQMREGHLWGKKDVAIPVADVDFTDGETIYLTIDKDAVQALPAVPVNRKGN